MRVTTGVVAACLLAVAPLTFGQTTRGLISGVVRDSITGRALAGVSITCVEQGTRATSATTTDRSGFYVLALLSPGTYRVQVELAQYQAQEVHELALPVAGRIDLPFLLRPLKDVWEAGQYRSLVLRGSTTVLDFYGPDLDFSRTESFEANRGYTGALESTVSNVVDPVTIADLPLAGRDSYTVLVTLPGVTADTATARSLGLSANGQRPSSANFLLDGLENNNNMVTGPLTAIAPEAIQEYRVSTNNFSAEYGGTSGHVANAVTRGGSGQFHGIGYFNFKNDVLNANDFQSNLRGLSRTPVKEAQPGFRIGGPLRHETLFFSGAYDYLRSRSRGTPGLYLFPTPAILSTAGANSIARKLMAEFPAPALPAAAGPVAALTLSPSVTVDRSLALPRLDWVSRNGESRFLARLAFARLSRPDFSWSPYPEFSAPYTETDASIAFSYIRQLRPGVVNEARFGPGWGSLSLDRPHPEIPRLVTADSVTLPGSQIFSTFSNRTRSWELVDNVTLARSTHTWKFGGEILVRTLAGELTAARDGVYAFATIADFVRDHPFLFRASLDRKSLPEFRLPRFDREYRLMQFAFFAQDSYRVTPRLVLNYGVRYESHGAPRNTGEVKDAMIALGSGASLAEKLVGARLTFPTGDQLMYAPDRNNWAGRVGFSWDLTGGGSTLLRGAYGTFYDRLFDNLWQNLRNNNFLFPRAWNITQPTTDYLAPAASVLPQYQNQPLASDYRFLTLFQPGIRTPYVHSYFFGLERRITDGWILDVNTLGSLGRKLLTTDIVNRFSGINPRMEDMIYRGNQGSSHYNALTALGRYRSSRAQIQLSYTWSHTIDNQSELLQNDYFNLNPIRLTGPGVADPSMFSRQFDSSGDLGNSAFDQRHNLVMFAIVDLPSPAAGIARPLLRNWKIAGLAAFRSGLPYTVFSPSAPYRADLVRPDIMIPATSVDVPGGRRLLNPAAFAPPAAASGLLGNTGRNAFPGPGFYNINVSVARTFALPWLGESGRLTLRTDAYNVLNHANLNNPIAVFPSPLFGIAQYGRTGPASGLPVTSPLNETGRQVQLLLRVEF